MAYDHELAERVRELVALRADVVEREMFGGIAWMLAGNMACGVIGDDLLVRLGPDEGRRALGEEHTRPFEMSGRPTKAFILVAPEGVAADEDLAGWVDAGADFAASLPPK